MKLEIRVNRDRCMGSGQCVHWAPGVFAQDEEAISVVVDPLGEPEVKVVYAMNCCPTEAITLFVDGIEVDTHFLEDWHRGSLVDAPLVPLLEGLSQTHDELRASLELLRQPAIGGSVIATEYLGEVGNDLVLDIVNSVSGHLALEEEIAFPAISTLVGQPLVEAFDRAHAAIARKVHTLSGLSEGGPDVAITVAELARILDDQIRLEETILFPVALGSLAAKPPV